MNHIDYILNLIDWNSDEAIQKRGILLAESVRNLDIFLQPKKINYWDNCAKILCKRSDQELVPYLPCLLEWLQDLTWPGAIDIFDRLAVFSPDIIAPQLLSSLAVAKQTENVSWIEFLEDLAKAGDFLSPALKKEDSLFGSSKSSGKIASRLPDSQKEVPMCDIDKIMELLDEDNPPEKQAEGILSAKNIKEIRGFIRPCEAKGAWKNCAKVLAERTDETLQPYGIDLLKWFRNPDIPGGDIIHHRLVAMPYEALSFAYHRSLIYARKTQSRFWAKRLKQLAFENGFFYSLEAPEQEFLTNWV